MPRATRTEAPPGGSASPGAGAEVLYILGSDWRAIDFVTEIEDTLGIPVLHPVLVRAWYIRRMLGLGAPVAGHGRLLAAMPPLPDMAR